MNSKEFRKRPSEQFSPETKEITIFRVLLSSSFVFKFKLTWKLTAPWLVSCDITMTTDKWNELKLQALQPQQKLSLGKKSLLAIDKAQRCKVLSLSLFFMVRKTKSFRTTLDWMRSETKLHQLDQCRWVELFLIYLFLNLREMILQVLLLE